MVLCCTQFPTTLSHSLSRTRVNLADFFSRSCFLRQLISLAQVRHPMIGKIKVSCLHPFPGVAFAEDS